ncbi:MAG: phytanoyl-CoA dioxygenase family protein [Armatimonadetes bacterium]|nr:phytanoyl-CoA dioxygenase family protein [Armatimonadota bacterium]
MSNTIVAPSAEEIRQEFFEKGYYLAKGVFSPSEVAELERDFDRIVDQLNASGENTNARWGGAAMDKMGVADTVVTHTHNVQKFSAAWSLVLFQERFLDVTEAILGPDIVLHHTKLFQKPAENGAPFPMHQDWDYFPSVKDSMIAGVIHVSRATDEMGCLRVFPGTHKLGRLDQSNGHADGEILSKYPIEEATPIEAEPGDVVFFHYFTIHGSMPNRSNEIRKTVLVQMLSGEDRIEDGITHPNARLVLRGFNHHVTRAIANED